MGDSMPWFLQWRRLLWIYRSASGGVCVVLAGRWFHIQRLRLDDPFRVAAVTDRHAPISPLEQYFNAVPAIASMQPSALNAARLSGSPSTPKTSTFTSWWVRLAQRAMAKVWRAKTNAPRAPELE
jgi:hypothetical protein